MERFELLIDYVERSIKEQLMDYVRNRKLSRSLVDLLDTESKVIDVAMEYGFAYEQSYTRAFRRSFGMSPRSFRRDKPEIQVTERLDLRRVAAVGEEGMVLEPAIRLRPAFSIVGERHELSVREDSVSHIANRLGNDFFYNKRRLVPGAKRPRVYIGYMALFPEEPDRVIYMPSVMVSSPPKSPDPLPEGMARADLPTRKYAVFTYIGFHHPASVTVNEYEYLYEHVYGSWLPASSYRIAGEYRFESIDEEVAREDYCEVELYIPIEEALPERGR